VFAKVFTADVERLAAMTAMWARRAPPVPLDYDAILAGPDDSAPAAADAATATAAVLPDQRLLSLRATAEQFVHSLSALAARGGTVEFDKDDDDVMDLVAATANLRAHVFGIERLSRFAAKAMAGNIIPAIATTNGAPQGVGVGEGGAWLTRARACVGMAAWRQRLWRA
jgi:ubiquitin-like 1-activating enzyme E1 B